jgi:RND family efflux transporter MFP subunit
MNKRKRNDISLSIQLVLSVGLLIFVSCGKGTTETQKTSPPAKVENAIEESELSTVKLTEQAEQRLGVEILTAEKRSMPASLNIGGEIMAPPGREAKVAAPVAGTILAAEGGRVPRAGQRVKKGEQILRLLFLPQGTELVGAREEVTVKREQYEVALSKAERAKQLLVTQAISEKANEDAQVELTRARAALNTAEARLNLLNGKDLNIAQEGLSTLVLESPVEGVLQRLFVVQGQTVPASTLLFEVTSLSPVWVRVPVYVGDLEKVDLEQEAVIKTFAREQPATFYNAKAVQGPPLSDADSASADLYFELENAERLLRIGQKVNVILMQKSSSESLIVPISAILYDIYGGTWVYHRIAPLTYTRLRVEISHMVGEYAVLIRGLEEGDEVVTEAVAEIYGTEFGVGK